MSRDKGAGSLATLSQWQLIGMRFRRHRLAVVGMFVLCLLYFVAIFAEFIAPRQTDTEVLDHRYCPPQLVRFTFSDGFHVNALNAHRDEVTFRLNYVEDPDDRIPLGFFVKGDTYELWGLFETDRHFFGIDHDKYRPPVTPAVTPGRPADADRKKTIPSTPTFYLLGSDKYGRDVFSRIVYGSRISLSVGLIGIAFTFILGMTIGGISGYVGGKTDLLIQRLIEILNSLPRLPMWIALAAIMPRDWSAIRVYFGITIVLSLLGWTRLARVVRGKILSLREEDYAAAARLIGASHRRILFRHLLPGFTSHIIVSLTLSVPRMILAETSLSFLGLGLRAPIVSWGVMLQDCMDIKAIRIYPWLLLPVVFIVATVLCFNFLGDGLRDAADPYSSR